MQKEYLIYGACCRTKFYVENRHVMRKNASTFEGIFPKIRPLKRPHFTTPHSTILYQSQIAIIYFFAIFPKIIFQVLQQAQPFGLLGAAQADGRGMRGKGQAGG